MRCRTASGCAFLFSLSLIVQAAIAAEPMPQLATEDVAFFEAKIRPVLVEHCYECHAADSKIVHGGLRVDTREALAVGGDSGPAVIPGNVEESLLLSAMRHESFEMPPEGKLPDHVIADFEQWIQRGAADPREGEPLAAAPSYDWEQARQFWAYRPLVPVTPPDVGDSTWPRTEMDRFVWQGYESQGLSPGEDASRQTLVRRLYFDLIGLPPSEAELANSDEPIETLIDRLLASPRFGERWGRHWLDVARFAESTGGGRSRVLHEAWRYRDYVLDAFNRDKPFDEFVVEQIAGDLLSSESNEQRAEQLAATSFLALGPINYELQDKELLRMEVIDEQIDTIGRALLGQTIGCARCHDHKFDPIPTSDYYALTGIFRSTKTLTPGNVSGNVMRNLPLPPEQQELLDKHLAAVDQLQAKVDAAKQQLKELGGQATSNVKNVRSEKLPGIVIDDTAAEVIGEWTKSASIAGYVDEGYLHDLASNDGQRRVIYRPRVEKAGRYEVRVSFTIGTNRAAAAPITVWHADGETMMRVDQRKSPNVDGVFHSLGEFRFEPDGPASITIANDGAKGHVIADAVQLLPVGGATNDARRVADASTTDADSDAGSESRPNKRAARRKLVQAELQKLETELAALKKRAPVEAAQVMSVEEEAEPGDYHICIRGNVHKLGPVVARGALTVASAKPALEISPGTSGRLELARWIASPDNPLTARVYVNRVWRNLFGSGIVPTPDNFGTTGEAPTHAELLDYLATQFIADGWSTKRLIRHIVLSRTYQLASIDAATDEQLRWLTHHARRRLDAEALRDAILSFSGRLDETYGGRVFPPNMNAEVGFDFSLERRAVYVPAFRNSLDELFQVFDFANPNMVTGNRNTSTLPTQALYLMNSPFVMRQADQAAERLLEDPTADDERRIVLAYRRAIGREPTAGELELSREFLAASGASGDAAPDVRRRAWSQFCQSLIACVDFRYLR